MSNDDKQERMCCEASKLLKSIHLDAIVKRCDVSSLQLLRRSKEGR